MEQKRAILSKQVLKDATSACPDLERQHQYWSSVNLTWAEHLLALFKHPDPPLLDSQDILQINNSYNSTVNRTNTQREHHLADLKIQQSELLQDIRAENSKLEDIYKELRDHNVAQAKAIPLGLIHLNTFS